MHFQIILLGVAGTLLPYALAGPIEDGVAHTRRADDTDPGSDICCGIGTPPVTYSVCCTASCGVCENVTCDVSPRPGFRLDSMS
jgi:hypothetical protein